MLRLLDSFYDRFCDPESPADPGPSFNADEPLFEAFVDRTDAIAQNATLLARHDAVQRAARDDRGFFLA